MPTDKNIFFNDSMVSVIDNEYNFFGSLDETPNKKKRSKSNSLYPTKSEVPNSFRNILPDSNTVAITYYCGNSKNPEFKNLSILNPNFLENTIFLTDNAAKDFKLNLHNCTCYADRYNLALQIYNNPKYSDKLAFISTNNQITQQILFKLKSQKLESFSPEQPDKTTHHPLSTPNNNHKVTPLRSKSKYNRNFEPDIFNHTKPLPIFGK